MAPKESYGQPTGSEMRKTRHSRAAICGAAVLRQRIAEHYSASSQAALVSGEVEPKAERLPFSTEFNCRVCAGSVALRHGCINAPSCVNSGSCEESWADLYPDYYLDEDGKPVSQKIQCAAEKCSVVIGFIETADSDGAVVPTVRGVCAVTMAGYRYHARGRDILNAMRAQGGDEIPAFDGEPGPAIEPPADL